MSETEVLWFTQIDDEMDLQELARIEVAKGTYERFKRMGLPKEGLKPGRVIVDLVESEYNLGDEHILIEAHHAHWLFKDFFNGLADVAAKVTHVLR